MVAIVSTVAYLGLEARAVEVQVQLIAGLPAFNLVGLADKAVSLVYERVLRKELPNDAARVAQLKAGQVDIIVRAPASHHCSSTGHGPAQPITR